MSIVGEAGIGKSRLAWELLKYVDGITEAIRWHQGRSPAYGEAVTFWALTEMVRSRTGIADTDEPLKARTKLRTAVAEHVTDLEEQQWIEPRLAGLLGLDDMPEGNRDELYAALRGFFQHISEVATTVLLFEDVHWADDGLLEFIEELVEMSTGHPILVITLARPEILERHPGWGAARHHFTSMHLGPLSAAEMTGMISGVVPGIPEHTVSLIIEQAGGVPLYAVEYVRMLVNSGDLVLEGSTYRQVGELAEVAMPDSLHALVGARLDRLDKESRSLIQDAAVLGQSFTVEGMTVLTGASADDLEPKLRDLARHEMLRYDTNPRSPERGQFQFIQSVIREVAYGRIAKTERKDRHLLVAEYYEREAPVEAAAVIASHYTNAYEAAPDSTMADAARSALIRAAQRATELKSLAQALALIEQALEVPGTEDQQALLWEMAAPAANALFRHEEAIGYARKAFARYAGHGTPDDLVRSAEVLGAALVFADEPQEAVEAMLPHFDGDRANEPTMMNLGGTLSVAHMRAGQMPEAAEVALSVMMAAEANNNMPLLIHAMNTRGTSMPPLKRRAEGVALLREAMRLAEFAALPLATLRAINNLNVLNAADGHAGLFESNERGYELARRIRHGALLVRLTTGYAGSLYQVGRFDEAIEVLSGLEISEESMWADVVEGFIALIRWAQTGDSDQMERARELNRSGLEAHEPQYRGHATSNEAENLWFIGDLEGAFEMAQHVITWLPIQEHWHVAVGAAIRLGDVDHLRTASALLEGKLGRRFDVATLAVDAGMELLEGDPDRAAAIFGTVITQYDEIDGPRNGAQWRAIFAEVMPDRQEARTAAEEAYEWFSEVGANGYIELYSHVWQQHMDQAAEAG